MYSRTNSAGREATKSGNSRDSYPFVFPIIVFPKCYLISTPVTPPCSQQLTSPSVSLLGKKEGCCHHFVLKSYFPVDPAVPICTAALQQDPSRIKVNSACIPSKNSSDILSCIFLEVKAKFCRKNQTPPSSGLPDPPRHKIYPSVLVEPSTWCIPEPQNPAKTGTAADSLPTLELCLPSPAFPFAFAEDIFSSDPVPPCLLLSLAFFHHESLTIPIYHQIVIYIYSLTFLYIYNSAYV